MKLYQNVPFNVKFSFKELLGIIYVRSGFGGPNIIHLEDVGGEIVMEGVKILTRSMWNVPINGIFLSLKFLRKFYR